MKTIVATLLGVALFATACGGGQDTPTAEPRASAETIERLADELVHGLV